MTVPGEITATIVEVPNEIVATIVQVPGQQGPAGPAGPAGPNVTDAVRYGAAQTLTSDQQTQARSNIAAQAASTLLAAFAGLTFGANTLRLAGADAALAAAPITPFAQSLLTDADATAMRARLGVAPGGADTQIQFNDGGAFNGSSALTYAKTNGILSVTSTIQDPPPSTGAVFVRNNTWCTVDRTGATGTVYGLASGSWLTAANTANWANSSAYPDLVGLMGYVTVAHGSTGSVRLAAGVYGYVANVFDGAPITIAPALYGDFSGTNMIYCVGCMLTGLDHGTNGTGVFLANSQSSVPPTGRWGIYDIAGYASVLTSLNLGATTDPGAGNLSMTGAVVAGAWQATKVALAYGGTGADLSATGGASQVLKQVTAGGAITVGQLAASDISGLGYFATGTNATNLTGTINNARLSAVPNSALANASVTIGTTAIALGGSAAALQGVSKLYPAVDSTTALQITKADGATQVGAWDTTNGGLNIGSTSLTGGGTLLSIYGTGAGTVITLVADGGLGQVNQYTYVNSASGCLNNHFKYRGTRASPLAVATNDTVGGIAGNAYDGSTVKALARINFIVSQYTAAGNISGAITFLTRNATANYAETMRLTETGGLNVGAYSADPGAANINMQGGVLKVSGTQVVAARNTGWTAQTATPSKGDLGASPTVGQLAAWAAAMQAALTTHGLIGA